MIVELIGPPGAGKTTLLPDIVKSFREQRTRAFAVVDAARPFVRRTVAGRIGYRLFPGPLRDPLLWRLFQGFSMAYRFRFIAGYPRLMWRVAESQRRRPEEADVRQRKVSYWFVRLIGYYAFLKSHTLPGEAVIFDEGFLHRVVQLFSSSVEEPERQKIAEYVELIPEPDLVVVVWASPETCERRIYERGLWERASHKDPAEISRFVANAHRAVTLAVDEGKRKGWTIVEIDNENDGYGPAQSALRQQMVRSLAPSGAAVGPVMT